MKQSTCTPSCRELAFRQYQEHDWKTHNSRDFIVINKTNSNKQPNLKYGWMLDLGMMQFWVYPPYSEADPIDTNSKWSFASNDNFIYTHI